MVNMSVVFDDISLELFDEVLQFLGLVRSLGCHFRLTLTVIIDLLDPRLVHLCGLPGRYNELWHWPKKKKNLLGEKKCRVTRWSKSEITHLEKIMNSRMFKFLWGHVIACNHILICHGLLKSFLSPIFIFNKIHRNPLRRLRRGRCSGLGHGHRWVYNMDLDGPLRCRRNRKARLDNPRLRQPMLRLLVSLTTGKMSQIQRLG